MELIGLLKVTIFHAVVLRFAKLTTLIFKGNCHEWQYSHTRGSKIGEQTCAFTSENQITRSEVQIFKQLLFGGIFLYF